MIDSVTPCNHLLHSLPIHSSSWSISRQARITTQGYLGAGPILIHLALVCSFPASPITFLSLSATRFVPKHTFGTPQSISTLSPSSYFSLPLNQPLNASRHGTFFSLGCQGSPLCSCGTSRLPAAPQPCTEANRGTSSPACTREGQRPPLFVPETPSEGGHLRWDSPHLSSWEVLYRHCGPWGAGTLAVTILQPILSPWPGDSTRTGVPFPSEEASAPSPAHLSFPDTPRLFRATLTATERTPRRDGARKKP